MTNYDQNERNRRLIEHFRSHDGVVSGEIHGRPAPFGSSILVLTHKGAKSGRTYETPLRHIIDGGRPVVFASHQGADKAPDWYHNIVANPEVTIEVGTEKYQARATVIWGPERDRLYAINAGEAGQFAEYEKRTKRVIPAIAFERIG